ncbi:MAG: hypothetical protein HYW01_08410 [Deltaproteobacteria bacterium]|nr:hypothetical protein [Deltaproteobacteria bacterium]
MFPALEGENRLKNQYKITVIIWFAMTLSVLIYVGLGLFLFDREDGGTGGEFKFLFYMLSFVSILSPRFFKSIILSGEKISNASSSSASNLAGLIQTYHMVTFAFCESIAIYGLVFYIIWGNKADFYILSGLSLICFIFNHPKFEFWQQIYERSHRLSGGLN